MTSRFSLLKKARRYYRNLDYPKAVEILETKFFEDDPIAHYILGEIYTYGNKRETKLSGDIRRAMKHFKRSSELGYKEASHEVAKNYELGIGVKASHNMASKFYLEAIKQGHVVAKYDLADLYIDHLPEKIPEAIRLLEEIITDKEYEGLACLLLGRLYLRGNGVEKDYKKARQWFESGLEYKNYNCSMELSYLYFYGLGVEKDLKKALALVEQAGEDHMLYEEVKEAIEKEITSPRSIH